MLKRRSAQVGLFVAALLFVTMSGAGQRTQGSGGGRQSVDLEAVARGIFDCTNVERRRAGLAPFEWSGTLSAAAAAHSSDMAARQYFSHTTKGFLRGKKIGDRVRAYDSGSRRLAENIAMQPVMSVQPGVEEALAAEAVRMWMRSKGHRENILNPSLQRLGVGTAMGMRNRVPYVYLTQNFSGN